MNRQNQADLVRLVGYSLATFFAFVAVVLLAGALT